MEWHKLTKRTMPPEETPILLWLDYAHWGFRAYEIRCGNSQK